MQKIQVGDSVRLNSGGPEMTVTAIEDGKATVEWKTESQFPEQCLTTFPQSSSLVPSGAESADIGKLETVDKTLGSLSKVNSDSLVTKNIVPYGVNTSAGREKVAIEERHYEDGRIQRKVGNGEWEDVPNPSGKPLFAKVEMGKVNRVDAIPAMQDNSMQSDLKSDTNLHDAFDLAKLTTPQGGDGMVGLIVADELCGSFAPWEYDHAQHIVKEINDAVRRLAGSAETGGEKAGNV